jgi:alcohol dehydrogenase (cytochrome c)
MKTWTGKSVATGGGATWTTGSYDVETDTLYWTVGNPFPATDGDEREGTNFYTNCVLAMEGQTGKLRWYYQLTPHDLQRLERHRAFSLGGHKI